MDLIALAIAPGIAICLFIFHRDAYDREPKLNLLVSFLLGAVVVLPVALVELFFHRFLQDTLIEVAISAYLVVALTEELGKFIVLRLYAFPKKTFDEPLDGIVYGVVIAMGFATVENIMYVREYGFQTAIVRMFLSVPAHGTFGVLMGYYAGKAKFDQRNKNTLLLKGVAWAVLFHGTFDFFLFLQGNQYVREYLSDLLLFLGAFASFVIAVRLSLRHVKQHRLLSQQTFRPFHHMSLRKAYPADARLIRELAFATWPHTYDGILSKDQLDYMLEQLYNEKTLEDQIRNNVEFILAYDGVHPVGFASISKEEPGVFKLHKIYVLPSQQGKGTGRFMMEKLEERIRKAGARTFRLNVNRNNQARSFYEKLGFQVTGQEDIDIGNGYYMNDFIMEKNMG